MTAVTRRTFLLVSLAAGSLAAAGRTPSSPSGADSAAVRKAIERLLGSDAAEQFVLDELAPAAGEADVFEIGGSRGEVRLAGSGGVALMSGLRWWLEHVAGGHLSTNGDRTALPDDLPAPAQSVRRSTELVERYSNNFTSFGYTSPFWGWSEWERELDRLAMSGVNRALTLVGQEIVWYEAFQHFGLSGAEVRRWIAQPAHQPWQWFGEITGYDEADNAHCGPVSRTLLGRRAQLGGRIADRMRELGITPVFPAFAGHVPDRVFAERNPDAHVVAQGNYAGHPRPYWLDCTDPLYPAVAERFYRAQAEHFGTTTHYSTDLFHEVGDDELPALLDGADLARAGVAVQTSLERAVPGARWLLQGWHSNPRRALLDAVDRERVVVLDMDSDDSRKWQHTEAYWGTPWCWGTINNFGGRLGMFGNLVEPGRTLPAVRVDPARRRLVGMAVVPEGTHHNPVVADLLAEMPWHREPVDLAAWVRDYARRRYGADDPRAAAAWDILLRTAYAHSATGHTSGEGPHETPFAAEPALVVGSASMWGPDQWRYDPSEFAPCLDHLLAVAPPLRDSAPYRYDLVDVTRQVLANRARLLLDRLRAAHESGDREGVARHSARFLRALDLSEEILGTHEDWLLGRRLAQARSWGSTGAEANALEREARTLITTWSAPAAPALREYANRDWHGLLSGYYRPRWERFFEVLTNTGEPPVFQDWAERGHAWARGRERYRTRPAGDTFDTAARIAAALVEDPL
ncbi:alpha-N-acetylglucosaminidase [Saccharothrix sp. BKS2]|uniref:alpha-N-acetylglucosaminidase n=1 Tax=Saccharothrix sp. BKS2 TaxID=3064400 RepID=UPI0039EBB500